jgi:hypothetical protein
LTNGDTLKQLLESRYFLYKKQSGLKPIRTSPLLFDLYPDIQKLTIYTRLWISLKNYW